MLTTNLSFLVLLVYFCILISVLIQISFLFDTRVNFKVIEAIWGHNGAKWEKWGLNTRNLNNNDHVTMWPSNVPTLQGFGN